VSEPPVVAVQLTAAEVLVASSQVESETRPSQWWYLGVISLAFWLSIEIGMSSAFMFVQILPLPAMVALNPVVSILFPLILFLAALATINNRYIAVAGRRARKRLADMGTPTEVEARYLVDAAGLSLETARGAWLAKWPAIMAIQQVQHGWVITSDLARLFIPSRAFESKDHERAFVLALVEGVDDPARQRSSDAAEFAAVPLSPPAP